jgi:pimeloyl-ACP methyl ester carboxylesterase
MPFITVAGERLFYTLFEGDPGRKRNLILVHGAGGDHTHWPAALRRLAGVNVYALDLPGHGRSAGRGRTSINDYADSVHLFAQTVGLKPAALAGHSMGGAIAQTLALRRPPWLGAIVLIGTGAQLRVDPLILEALQKDFEAAVDTLCQWAYGPTQTGSMQHQCRRLLLRTDADVVRGDYAACNAFDVRDRVSEITLPTLIVTGSADQMTPPGYGEYLRDRIVGAHLVEIKDGGHMMAVEKPAEVTQAVARFLGALLASRSTL